MLDLLVLRLLISKPFPGLRELPKLVADHILRYPDILIDLAVVHLEDETDKVREDGGTSGLSFDRWRSFAWLWSDDGQA